MFLDLHQNKRVRLVPLNVFKKVSEYDQDIPKSHNADQLTAL